MEATRAGPLLEREEELSRLAECLAAIPTGGRSVVVEGPPGIGKTRLLEAARAFAGVDQLGVLFARGSELEREFAFGVVRQLFEPVLQEAGGRARRRLLSGAARAVAPLVTADAPALPAGRGRAFPLLHGLYWLAANLAAEAPLVVIVDDGHWADLASLRWLSFLAARLHALPLLLVVATRAGEPARQGGPLADLVAGPGVIRLLPPPLSQAAAGELVRQAVAAAASTEFCRACHAATRGNPLLLHELITALREEGVAPTDEGAARVLELGPRSVGESVQVRLDRMGGGALKLARSLAVLGGGADLGQAAELAALDPAAAARAADLLALGEVIEPRRPLAFVHPIVRSAVYAGMPLAERGRTHRDAARMLAGAGAQPEQLAAHLLASDPGADQWTVQVLRMAARRAVRRGAPEAAAAYLRRAAAEPPSRGEQSAVLRELGEAEFQNHDPAAIGHLQIAHQVSGEAGDRARLASELATALIVAGRSKAAVEVLEAAGGELAGRHPQLALRLSAELLAAALLQGSTRSLFRTRVVDWSPEGLGEGLGDRFMLGVLAQHCLLEGRPAGLVGELATRALGGGALLSEATSSSPMFYLPAAALLMADRMVEATEWLGRAIADARRRGSVVGHALASGRRAEAWYRRGWLEKAEADARAKLGAGPEIGDAVAGVPPLVLALAERGRLAEAESLLAAFPQDLEGSDQLAVKLVLFARAALRAGQGRLQEAVHDLVTLGGYLDHYGCRNPSLAPWRSHAAVALAGLGDRDRAEELAARETALARPLGQPRSLGIALRAHGVVAGGPDGIELLEEAVAVLEASAARLEHGRALVDLGAALRRAGYRGEAGRRLRRGLDLAHRCRATPLVERARRELFAVGARPRRPALSGVEALTATERRVAEMAGEGLGNAELAKALFVSPKTIETHLSHAFQKLGIRSRRELPPALAAAALDPAGG